MPRWRQVTFGLADLGVLIGLRPDPAALNRIAHPHAWVADVGADRVAAEVCTAGIWFAAAWVTLAVSAGLTGALPGVAGRIGAGVARALLPRAVYRILAGAAGLGVLLTPALASAAAASHPVVAASQPTPTPQWPTDSPVHPPQWPTTPTARHSHPQLHEHGSERHHRHRPEAVVVRPGDTLWDIAADHLPGRRSARRVAAAWPRWYAANRAVIGDDPAVIVAGQHLRPPAEGSTP